MGATALLNLHELTEEYDKPIIKELELLETTSQGEKSLGRVKIEVCLYNLHPQDHVFYTGTLHFEIQQVFIDDHANV